MTQSTGTNGTDRASMIAAVLQANIVSGHYAIDERLPSEADLCAHFEVSRPTLREALGRLAALGLITSRRGSGGGTFVAQPDPAALGERLAAMVGLMAAGEADPLALTRARILVQTVCAELAAALRSGYDDIRAEIDLQSDFNQPLPGFVASCQRMHLAICAASGNGVLSMLGQALVTAEFSRTGQPGLETRERARLLSYHVRIANGISGGRPQDCRQALSDLLSFEAERAAPQAESETMPERPPRMRDLRLPRVQRLDTDDGGGSSDPSGGEGGRGT